MTNVKSYTDLEQSKKLAKILPIETADMCWTKYIDNGDITSLHATVNYGIVIIDYPCWSLAALLDVLPKIYYPVKDHPTCLILGKPKDKWCALYWDTTGMQDGEQTRADNPVDACYDMILKLNELNLL